MNPSILKPASLAIATTAAVLAASAQAAVPEVSGVSMSQNATDRTVTINYTLSDAPAVVTLDIQTNANTSAAANDPGWTSIGGGAIWNARGDVWKKVETGSRTITWKPDLSWPNHKIEASGARAVVTAWATNNTPDYMVVHLDIAGAVPSYYPAADFLPKASYDQEGAAVTNNPAYKRTKILMRKVMAKDITWTMGSTSVETERHADPKEKTHEVTLDGNYYIGVFPITQYQWLLVKGSNPSYFTTERDMRPVEKITYIEARLAGSNSASEDAPYWPAAPHGNSFLGLLNSRTGLDFDLPSEAQWEFAARAGNGDGLWGDGSAILNTHPDANLARLGRYNRPNNDPSTTAPNVGGTSIVGSYAPNSWGIYDMHGNVLEICLDWYAEDITSLGGAVNTTRPSGNYIVARGGSWNNYSGASRPARRNNIAYDLSYHSMGLRVVCTAGLK